MPTESNLLNGISLQQKLWKTEKKIMMLVHECKYYCYNKKNQTKYNGHWWGKL